MILTNEEKAFFQENKAIIQSILKKKLEDVFNDIMYNEDEERVKTLRLWAKEIKELIETLDKLVKVKDINQDTGI